MRQRGHAWVRAGAPSLDCVSVGGSARESRFRTRNGLTVAATGTCAWRGLAAPWPPRYHALGSTAPGGKGNRRTLLNVVDADGHFSRATHSLGLTTSTPCTVNADARFVITDDNGKEQLSVEERSTTGNPRGIAQPRIFGVRQGEVKLDSLKYADGRKVASTRTPTSPTWSLTGSTPRSSTQTSRPISPGRSRAQTQPPRCAAPTIAGSRITASNMP